MKSFNEWLKSKLNENQQLEDDDVESQGKLNLVISKNGINIYKINSPEEFEKMGGRAKASWSLSNSAMWDLYAKQHGQTQYMIYDKNKNDSAKYVSAGVAKSGGFQDWVDLSNMQNYDKDGVYFGVAGYDSLEEYKNYLAETMGISVDELDNIMRPF